MKSTTRLFATGTAMAAGLIQGSAQEAPALFKVGNVEVRPNASYSAVYDDNIFLEHHHKGQNSSARPGRDHDFVHTFSPGLRLQAGDVNQRQSAYMAFNYQAQFLKFSKTPGADAIDQNGSLEAGVYLNKLKLGLTQSMTRASAADVANLAANGRVRRANYDTTLDADYEISEKTHANLILSQAVADYQAPLVDSTTRSAALFLDYQMLPKVKMGIGGDIGYMQVDGNAVNHNPNSLYYSGLVRLNWQATEKVTIGGSTGVQHMNIQEQGAEDPVSFVFALNASWKVAERTTLRLSADRRRRVSNALGAQQNEETSVAGNLSHQLADALTLTLDGGYTQSHYMAASRAVLPVLIRDDQYIYVKPSLAYRFLERAQASLFYQYRRNDSNSLSNGNDFYANQIGLELSYRF